jgi:hypothetical protein
VSPIVSRPARAVVVVTELPHAVTVPAVVEADRRITAC